MLSRKKKLLEAYRAVLSWLHQKHLKVGDKIPAQIPLGEELGICQGTLGAAMRLLVEDKLLDRRQKAGSVIKNLWPQNPHRRLWTVGIVMPELCGSGFFAAVTMQLHRELANRNFSDRIYFISPQSLPSSEVDVRQPSDFLGLESDLEEGLVDALLTSTRLFCDTIPCVALGGTSPSTMRVSLNQPYFFENAVEELYARGNRHMYLVGAEREEVAISTKKAAEISPDIEITVIPLPSLSEWAAETAAEKFLALSDGQEDCGLIVKDDFVASILSRKIVRISARRPLVCLQTYDGSPLYYSLPVLKYITDLRVLSAAAVDMVVSRLLGTATGKSEVRLPLIVAEEKEPGTSPVSHHLLAKKSAAPA